MAAPSRAPRRTTEEVRDLILDAATRLFGERGYARTSMRDIAGEAEISLSVLYRQFSGKEELFSATLLAPFLESFEAFSVAWADQVEQPWDDERLIREFVRDLYGNLTNHRDSLLTLLAVDRDTDSELLASTRRALSAGLQNLRLMAEHEADRRQWFSRDTVAYSNTFMIALIAGMVLLEPLLVGTITDEDSDVTIDALTKLALHGMRLAPPA